MKSSVITSALILCFFQIALTAQAQTVSKPIYAIVASEETFQTPEWNQAAESLEKKHAQQFDVRRVAVSPSTLKTEQNPSASQKDASQTGAPSTDAEFPGLKELRELKPYYTCFLLRSEEAGPETVVKIHQMTRTFDDDPYTDTLWGILTGFDAQDALRIAEAPPLEVRKVSAGTPIPLARFESGVWYDEGQKNHYVQKTRKADGTSEITDRRDGPDDTTHALADAWKDADLFITSGHASTRDWNPGYSYRNGNFRSRAGKLLGVPLNGESFEVVSETPKVHIAAGNCLIGAIDGPDCMALAEIHSLGVCAFAGYTVPSWFGYMGWGVLEYYIGQPGDFTASEAFFASNQALTFRLVQVFPELFDGSSREKIQERFSKMTAAQRRECQGLLYDRDSVAFYGDPAWKSALIPPETETYWNQKLERGADGVWTLTVQQQNVSPSEGSETHDAGNSGETRDAAEAGSSDRPWIVILPSECVEEAAGKSFAFRETEGTEKTVPQVYGNFLLIPKTDKNVKIQWKF